MVWELRGTTIEIVLVGGRRAGMVQAAMTDAVTF
jgi:hypothetical protein